jgi:hypothetical protein
LIATTKIYKGKVKPNATPTAASTISTIPMMAKTIPKILAMLVATGGNMPATAYNMIPIIRTTIPPTKLITSYYTKKVINT